MAVTNFEGNLCFIVSFATNSSPETDAGRSQTIALTVWYSSQLASAGAAAPIAIIIQVAML